jgi:hypothetical protein
MQTTDLSLDTYDQLTIDHCARVNRIPAEIESADF